MLIKLTLLQPEVPNGESITTVYGINYELIAVMLLKLPNGHLLVAVNHSQQQTIVSALVDPINWPLPPTQGSTWVLLAWYKCVQQIKSAVSRIWSHGLQSIRTLHALQSIRPLHCLESIMPLHDLQSIRPLHDLQSIRPLHALQSIRPLHDLQSIRPLHALQSIRPLHACRASGHCMPFKASGHCIAYVATQGISHVIFIVQYTNAFSDWCQI